MTNSKKKQSPEHPLFDWVKRVESLTRQASSPAKGSLNISHELCAAMADDIKHARDERGMEFSRAQVAARMTDFLGVEITVAMLDNWTAPSKPHRFPAEYLPAFVHGTGGQRRAFEVLSRHSGLFALPGPEALRAEIQRLDEEERRIKNEKTKRRLFLQEIEGKK